MKKRTAYIGISYPLLYDYRYQADKSPNDLLDSPNPIIESPLGLMIFYDKAQWGQVLERGYKKKKSRAKI